MAPDLDALIRSDTDPLLYLEYHRQFTHSLAFVPLGAALCALVLYPLCARRLRWREVWLYCAAGYATHGLLDACTSYGTQLLWPFSALRVAWDVVSIVDPLLTVPLLVLFGIALWRRRAMPARCALAWLVCYLGVGAMQHQRALEALRDVAAARGHVVERAAAKPAFGNLLLWKTIYASADRYYVDAVRLGRARTRYPGQSVARLELARDLPWLAPGSQQARDIERFRWFSDDFLALDPADPDFVVDMRYSLVPDEIAALWGIRLDRNAAADAHVGFEWRREVTPERRARFLAMLAGVGR